MKYHKGIIGRVWGAVSPSANGSSRLPMRVKMLIVRRLKERLSDNYLSFGRIMVKFPGGIFFCISCTSLQP